MLPLHPTRHFTLNTRQPHKIFMLANHGLFKRRRVPSTSNHGYTIIHRNQHRVFCKNHHEFSFLKEMDFFGEPVTFTMSKSSNASLRQEVMAVHDEYLLGVLSYGKMCRGGGGDEGLEVQAAHSFAMVYAKFLNVLFENYEEFQFAPKLAVAAVMPMLASAGVDYVRHVDGLLSRAANSSDDLFVDNNKQLLSLAQNAVSVLCHSDNNVTSTTREADTEDAILWNRLKEELTPPEILHLEAMDFLLQDKPKEALQTFIVLLTRSPGDALALMSALELSYRLGDDKSAALLSGCVASYWSERAKTIGGVMDSPGHFLGSSMIALGFAAASGEQGNSTAEGLATAALSQDYEASGSVAARALCTVYEAEGRSSEGQSVVIGSDGSQNVDGSGWLFNDSRLMGFGARFILDRDGLRANESALRLYDSAFSRVFESCNDPVNVLRKSPGNERTGIQGFMNRFNPFKNNNSEELDIDNEHDSSEYKMNGTKATGDEYSLEDVLTWLPPTPQLLTDATILLLNLTINQHLSGNDKRWIILRQSWLTYLCLRSNSGEASNTLERLKT